MEEIKDAKNTPDNKIGRHMEIYAQSLRLRGLSLDAIAAQCGVSKSWVHRHTTPGRLPAASRRDLMDLIEVLILKTVLDAIEDNGENPKEFAWPLSQYTNVLKQLEEMSSATTRRNIIEGVKALQERMSDAPPEMLDRLQVEYDKALNNEE